MTVADAAKSREECSQLLGDALGYRASFEMMARASGVCNNQLFEVRVDRHVFFMGSLQNSEFIVS